MPKNRVCATDYKTSPNRMNSGVALVFDILQFNKTIQSETAFGFVDESAMRVPAEIVS